MASFISKNLFSIQNIIDAYYVLAIVPGAQRCNCGQQSLQTF